MPKEKLYLHPATETELAKFKKKPAQSVLFSGKKGSGLSTVALHFAHDVTNVHHVTQLKPDESKVIKIEAIRHLHTQLRTKSAHTRVIFIDEAEKMTVSSQNALLKLLEEPPKHTVFILTSHEPYALLPTIRSRVQEMTVHSLHEEQTKQLIADKKVSDPKKIIQLTFLAKGLPSELIRLIESEEYFEQRSEETRQARDFISQNTYQKMIFISSLGNDREKALQLLDDAIHIIKSSLLRHPDVSLAHLLENLLFSYDKLRQDGHIKAQLMRLALT